MEALLLIFIMAIIMEMIDSSLGMMYGTVLSPFLIGLGFSPIQIIPAILLSQALGGVFASYRHHQFKNGSFSIKSEDFKVSLTIFSLGIIAIFIAVVIGTVISKYALSLYIAILMVLVGLLVVAGIRLKFTWGKIYFIGFLSAFNKALSGGGFGPIVTSGQLIVGRNGKNAVSTTTMSEVQICLVSFIVWIIFNDGDSIFNPLIVTLCAGAMIGGLIGPYLLSKIKDNKKLIKATGILAILSGVFALIKLL